MDVIEIIQVSSHGLCYFLAAIDETLEWERERERERETERAMEEGEGEPIQSTRMNCNEKK